MIYEQSEPSEILRQMAEQGLLVPPLLLSAETQDDVLVLYLDANGKRYSARWVLSTGEFLDAGTSEVMG